jgi:hypothetical protein
MYPTSESEHCKTACGHKRSKQCDTHLQTIILIKLDVIVRQKALSEISLAELLTQRPVFDFWQAHVGFMVVQVVMGEVLFPATAVLAVSSHKCSVFLFLPFT